MKYYEVSITDIPVNAKFKCVCKNNYWGYGCEIGRKYNAMKEDEETVFVFPKGCSRHGYRMGCERFNQYFTALTTDETEEWHKRIHRALKAINESGLWPDKKTYLENLLKMTWEDRKAINDIQEKMWAAHWNKNMTEEEKKNMTDTLLKPYIKKYPFIVYKCEDGTMALNTDYCWELSAVNLKTMYFGYRNKYFKDRIKEALKNKENYDTGRIVVNYDNSFSYNADRNQAYYDEEFRDCGNGHYYIALNENVAWFLEND